MLQITISKWASKQAATNNSSPRTSLTICCEMIIWPNRTIITNISYSNWHCFLFCCPCCYYSNGSSLSAWIKMQARIICLSFVLFHAHSTDQTDYSRDSNLGAAAATAFAIKTAPPIEMKPHCWRIHRHTSDQITTSKQVRGMVLARAPASSQDNIAKQIIAPFARDLFKE